MQKSKGFKGLINEYKEKELVNPPKPSSNPPPPTTTMVATKPATTANATTMVATAKPKERYAFAIIHFGSNPVYLELEMYFFKMLRKYTSNDIIYLYYSLR
jgi:hypothetical protein